MPYEIGYVENAGVLAHMMMVEKFKTFAEANGYTVLRYVADAANAYEVILKAPGYSGTEEIFIGFKTYHSISSDYYNIKLGAFTGYVSGNTFETQPGVIINSVCGHNNRIDYWITLTPQRIAFALKVGTPVYESGYLGKAFPYSAPSQYPYPVVCGGTLAGSPATRFSDTSHKMPFVGSTSNFSLRLPSGVWANPETHPWNNAYLNGSTTALRDTENNYPLLPVELMTSAQGQLGELEGIFYISGFNNAVENTLPIGGDNFVVFQNVYRTGFADYFAMRLDA